MKFTPNQLLALSVTLFGGIVALGIAAQIRANAELRDRILNANSVGEILGRRQKLIDEENMIPKMPNIPSIPVPDLPVLSDDEESEGEE